MSLLRDRTGLWYRRSDTAIILEVPGVYGNVPIERGDVVLDLGAHIGISTRLWLAKGAAKVIAVEADPANVRILRRNVVNLPVKVWPGAVGREAGTAAFWVRPGYGYVGSTRPGPGRVPIGVPVVTLGVLLERYRPTVLKFDVEFAEYDLPELADLPTFVRVLAAEVHVRLVMTPETDPADLRRRREAAAALIAAIEGQGFVNTWRVDKQAKPGLAAEPDASGLGPMTKCVCATWVRA